MGLLHYILIGASLAQPIDSSFFVYPDGRYVLSIRIQGEWRAAELNTSMGPSIEISDWPDDGLVLRGNIGSVPDHLWVNLRLANDKSGLESSFSIPTILVPIEMPQLGGEETAALPKMSFKWQARLFMEQFFSGGSRRSKSKATHSSDYAVGKRVN